VNTTSWNQQRKQQEPEAVPSECSASDPAFVAGGCVPLLGDAPLPRLVVGAVVVVSQPLAVVGPATIAAAAVVAPVLLHGVVAVSAVAPLLLRDVSAPPPPLVDQYHQTDRLLLLLVATTRDLQLTKRPAGAIPTPREAKMIQQVALLEEQLALEEAAAARFPEAKSSEQ